VITFKQYLNEVILKKWEEEPVEHDKLFDLLIKSESALKAIENGGLLFRGFNTATVKDSVYIDPTSAARTSRDSYNLYQLGMDRSVSLQDYPKRSHSLICSTSWHHADDYGNVFVVFPPNNAKVVMSNVSDFLEQPIESDFGSRVTSLDKFFRRLCNLLDIEPNEQGKFIDAKPINAALDAVTSRRAAELVFDAASPADLIYYEKFFETHKRNRFDALASDELTPRALELRLKKFGETLSPDRGVECWVDTRCLVIAVSRFASIIRQLEDADYSIYRQYIGDATAWHYKN
jgi:hypothetical protein